MQFKTEEINQKQKTLFLYKDSSEAINLFKKKLEANEFEIFSSPVLPHRLEYFNSIFIFYKPTRLQSIIQSSKCPIYIIIFNNLTEYKELLNTVVQDKTSKIKVVHVDEDQIDNATIEHIIWFLLSSSSEKGLNLAPLLKKKTTLPHKKLNKTRLKKRSIFFILFAIFLCTQLLFILPLLINGFFLYKSASSLKAYDIQSTKKYLYLSAPYLNLTKESYLLARPIWSFFYVGIIPDNIISLEENAQLLIGKTIEVNENGKQILSLIIETNKTSSQKQEAIYRIKTAQTQLDDLIKYMNAISQNLDYPFKEVKDVKEKLSSTLISLNQLKGILKQSDYILGATAERKYLLLFENNMELRPGGGFIGSYGIATVQDYTLKDFKVQDVYEADGQLKVHVDPPDAIRTYLNQPHWFLRDSNFTPDFPANFEKAEFFLGNEMNQPSFDGGIAITTTAINSIIEAVGDIYLPDYNDTINKDNFYIKTQTEVEQGFFPGSTQKRNYLSSVANALLIKLESDPTPSVLLAVKKSFDEKQMVAYVKNEALQKDIDDAGWSGKIITPQCALDVDTCIIDSFYIVDANLGVNKANFFVKRFIDFSLTIDKDGQLNRKTTILYHNDSSLEVFPGGTYKNYLQVYIPKEADISKITADNVVIDKYDSQVNGAFRVVGFYFEVKPKSDTTIQFTYTLPQKITKGQNGYQLIVQKQIGSSNNDIRLEFNLPKGAALLNKNFSAFANDNQLIYNTSLTTDKIFFIEFSK